MSLKRHKVKSRGGGDGFSVRARDFRRLYECRAVGLMPAPASDAGLKERLDKFPVWNPLERTHTDVKIRLPKFKDILLEEGIERESAHKRGYSRQQKVGLGLPRTEPKMQALHVGLDVAAPGVHPTRVGLPILPTTSRRKGQKQMTKLHKTTNLDSFFNFSDTSSNFDDLSSQEPPETNSQTKYLKDPGQVTKRSTHSSSSPSQAEDCIPTSSFTSVFLTDSPTEGIEDDSHLPDISEAKTLMPSTGRLVKQQGHKDTQLSKFHKILSGNGQNDRTIPCSPFSVTDGEVRMYRMHILPGSVHTARRQQMFQESWHPWQSPPQTCPEFVVPEISYIPPYLRIPRIKDAKDYDGMIKSK